MKKQVDEIIERFNREVLKDPDFHCVMRYKGNYLYLDRFEDGHVSQICRLRYTGDMKTYIQLQLSHQQPLPAVFQDDDVRYPESLVEHFLREYTHEGDTILDPFAGYGTTLIVAERMGRIPFGVELNGDRVNYVRSKLAHPESIVQGDSRLLANIDLPPIDFSMTSPPYMNRDDLEDPFTNYQAKGQGYRAYLREIRSIYQQLGKHMKPTGTVVIEVSNLKQAKQVTTLAWDIGQAISQVLYFDGEVIVCWDKYGYGYDHSYCLVYSVQ